MSQKASAADEVSTLCNHHVRFGSQHGPWLRSGDHGGTCDLQSFRGLQDPFVRPAPTPQAAFWRGWWFSPLKHLDFIQVSTNNQMRALHEIWLPPLWHGRNTLLLLREKLRCVPILLLALLACCWESPVWTCCHSENIFIPEHWGDLINWAKLPCKAVGRFIVLLAVSDVSLPCPVAPTHCTPAAWGLLWTCNGAGSRRVREVLHQIRNKHIRDCSPTSSFGYRKQSFLNTTLHTQFLVPVSSHLEASIANFAFLMQHPVNSFFLLSLLKISFYQHYSNTIRPLSALQTCRKTVLQAVPHSDQSLVRWQTLVGLLFHTSRGLREGEGNFSSNCPLTQYLYSKKEEGKKQCCKKKA